MENKNVKLIIGFITYGQITAKYLPYFLASIKEQSFCDFRLIAVDNSEEENNSNKVFMEEHYADLELEWMGGNLGFAKANNIIISKAKQFNPEYVMFLNPDTVLNPFCVEKMIETMDRDTELGSVSAKIKVWDFEKNIKSNIIDSYGIVLRRGLRMVDLGQNQADTGQFENNHILGPSGTAPMYSMDALEAIKDGKEYFAENMFMYKEDCDLAYRLYLKGFKSELVNEALVFHHRTAFARGESIFQVMLNRKNKSRDVKRWSFLNQHILFIKFWHLESFINKLVILWYAFRMFVFVSIFEHFLLKEYLSLFKLKIKSYKI